MFVPVTHISSRVKIRRAHMLPNKGNVLVLVGQQVGAMDIIAEAPSRSKHLLIDVPIALGVPVAKFKRDLITRNVGDKVLKGDVLAETNKNLNRILRSPEDGEILMISRGRILLEVQEQAVPIHANFPGKVVEVIPDYGVILETSGSLIQGVWGNGQVGMGPLHIIRGEEGNGLLTIKHIDQSLCGVIGVACQCRDKAALLAAAELPMKGLILGSMSSDLIETAGQMKIPVILLEGFTGAGINQAAARILYENENQEVCINSVRLDRYRGNRPEVIIPFQGISELVPDMIEFRQGRMVRVIDEPFKSAIGIIEVIHPEPVLLENGLRTKVAVIRLENNKKVSAPIVNLEILD